MSDGREGRGPAAPGMAPAPTAEPPVADPVERQAEPVPAPRRQSVDALARFIVQEAGPPIDVWAIAALLESIGIRDRDAAERYGRRDVFALAQAVQIRLPEHPPSTGWVPPAPAPRRERLARYARIYGRGTFFFVPLVLQLIALLAVGVSQFASLDFTTRDASLVAVAAALSFVVTAGFSQALGYVGPIYIETGKHMAAETVCWTILGTGAIVAVLVGVIAYVVASATGGYSHEDLRIMAGYYLLLAAQGLAGALLYMLRKFLAMVVATVVSLVLAAVLYRWSSLAIYPVHYAALGLGVAIELGVGVVILRRRARDTRGDLRLARLPRAGLLLRRALPFGVYGLVYFSFLTADRGVAWAAGTNPLPLWFHSSYELGLDWALGGILFALAFLEVTVEDFSDLLSPSAERFGVDAVREHNRSIGRFWARQLAGIAALMAAGTLLAIGAAVALHTSGALGEFDRVYDDPVTRYVFGMGIVGYAALTLGIANSVFVMTLNRPWRAVAALAPGAAVSIAVGVAATTVYSYWTAVFGMVVGAGVFALLSTWQAWRTLRRADYYSFSAY